MRLRLHLQIASDAASLPGRGQLVRWARAALADVSRPLVELGLRIVDEPESAELNRRYRRKSGPTNVLSFPFQAPAPLASPMLGDLVVCAPVVAREAAAQGKPARAHWAHMLVHGVLHLRGYDHQNDAEARRMERRETAILAGLGFADPYVIHDV